MVMKSFFDSILQCFISTSTKLKTIIPQYWYTYSGKIDRKNLASLFVTVLSINCLLFLKTQSILQVSVNKHIYISFTF